MRESSWMKCYWRVLCSKYCGFRLSIIIPPLFHIDLSLNRGVRVMTSTVSRRPLTVEDTGVRSLTMLCGIYNGKSGTRTSFSHTTSLSAVSIIPPTLYTHSFIYVRLCVFLETESVIRQHTGRIIQCHPGDGHQAHENPKF
jgi:hypothetical protein